MISENNYGYIKLFLDYIKRIAEALERISSALNGEDNS